MSIELFFMLVLGGIGVMGLGVVAAMIIVAVKSRRPWKPAVPFVAETTYTIPRIGEHPRILCVVGRHWWTLMRDGRTKTPLGVRCGACHKTLRVHDKVDTPSTPPSIRNE